MSNAFMLYHHQVRVTDVELSVLLLVYKRNQGYIMCVS